MRGKKARAQKRDAKIKGDIVESIVAQMHDARGVIVERNVRLTSLHNPKRRREIDVLLTAQVAGYPVRFAFECKNYGSKAGVEKIGEFADKLLDVGLPTQSGIFVSASGFTQGALDRAKQIGMQTLVVTGLADDRRSSAVVDALQSIIFLLPVATQLTIVNDAEHVENEEIWYWFDEKGVAQATTPDLLWHRWRDGAIPSRIGAHEIKVDAPGWTQRIGGKVSVPNELKFGVHVHGLVLTLAGQANDHILFDMSQQSWKKRQIDVRFEAPGENASMRVFDSEDDFTKFVNGRPETVRVVTRMRLPRLLWKGLFWPVSDRVRGELAELQKVKPPEDVTEEDFVNLERRSLGSVWETFPVPKKPPKQ